MGPQGGNRAADDDDDGRCVLHPTHTQHYRYRQRVTRLLSPFTTMMWQPPTRAAAQPSRSGVQYVPLQACAHPFGRGGSVLRYSSK